MSEKPGWIDELPEPYSRTLLSLQNPSSQRGWNTANFKGNMGDDEDVAAQKRESDFNKISRLYSCDFFQAFVRLAPKPANAEQESRFCELISGVVTFAINAKVVYLGTDKRTNKQLTKQFEILAGHLDRVCDIFEKELSVDHDVLGQSINSIDYERLFWTSLLEQLHFRGSSARGNKVDIQVADIKPDGKNWHSCWDVWRLSNGYRHALREYTQTFVSTSERPQLKGNMFSLFVVGQVAQLFVPFEAVADNPVGIRTATLNKMRKKATQAVLKHNGRAHDDNVFENLRKSVSRYNKQHEK